MTFRTHEPHQLTCAEASPLLERYNIGEVLTPTERKAVDRHLACCSGCMDIRIFCRAGALAAIAPRISETDLEATISAALDVDEKRASVIRRLRLFAVSAVVAVAAIVGVYVMVSLHSDTGDTSPGTSQCAATEPVEIFRGVFLNRCVDRPVETVVGADGDVHVTVESGAVGVSVDPMRPNKNRVTVHTRFGAVTVKGTVFTVNVEEDGAKIEVFRGTVEIHPEASDSTILVSRNGGVRLEANGRYQLQEATTNSLWTKLDARLEKTAGPGVSGPDDHRQLSSKADPIVGEGVEAAEEIESVRSAAVTRISSSQATPNRERGLPSLDRLLTEARNCLLDEDWSCAAAKYKKIIWHYEERWDAMSALISLAKLELRHLGKTRQALSHFADYMKRYPDGPLLEEAVFGTAECHRRLGNRDKELSILRSYVKKHPANTGTAKMKKRIRELESN